MRFVRSITLLVAALALSTGLFAQSSKLSPDLQVLLSKPNPPANLKVLVQLNPPGLLQTVTGLVNGVVGITNDIFNLIPVVSKTLRLQDLTSLINNPNVAYITLDRQVRGAVDTSSDDAIETVGADIAATYGYAGQGVGVAIIDSGISAHSNLASRVVYRESFIGGGSKLDDYGHGTHVAGIVAGSVKGSDVRGIATGANLIDLRVLDANGMSSDSVIIAALERAVELKSKYNIRVINLSLGRPIFESYKNDPLVKAVEAAWKKGIVVVVASGNLGRSGYATILSPANSPAVITVGAMKTADTPSKADDNIASYSSKGPTWGDLVVKPDVVAPGNLIVGLRTPGSTLDKEYPANVVNGSYTRMSGTSMAAPMVSGTAALLIARDSSLTPDAVKSRLMKTASKRFPAASVTVDKGVAYPAVYDMYTVGAGYLDVAAALASNDLARGSAASPTVSYVPLLRQAIITRASDSLWDNNAWSLPNVWGTHSVEPLTGITNLLSNLLGGLGGSSVNGTAAAWGSTAAWGSAAAWGSSAAWGSTAAWGSSAAWGSTAAWGSSAAWGSAAAWGSSADDINEK